MRNLIYLIFCGPVVDVLIHTFFLFMVNVHGLYDHYSYLRFKHSSGLQARIWDRSRMNFTILQYKMMVNNFFQLGNGVFLKGKYRG